MSERKICRPSTRGQVINGFLQNDPAEGCPAQVIVSGITRAIAGADFDSACPLIIDDRGGVISAQGEVGFIVGHSTEAARKGEVILIQMGQAFMIPTREGVPQPTLDHKKVLAAIAYARKQADSPHHESLRTAVHALADALEWMLRGAA